MFAVLEDRDQLCHRLGSPIEAMAPAAPPSVSASAPRPRRPPPSRCSQHRPRKASGRWAVKWFIIKYKCDNINKFSQTDLSYCFLRPTFMTWLFRRCKTLGLYILGNLQPFLQLSYLSCDAAPPHVCHCVRRRTHSSALTEGRNRRLCERVGLDRVVVKFA